MRKEIVIVGGGTAGWLTALTIQKLMGYDANISIIESEEIGIIGAGEGSTPNFPGLINWLGIDYIDFLIKTNATYKIGISFENWNNMGDKYFHPFTAFHNKFDWAVSNNKEIGVEYIGYLNSNNLKLDDYVLSSVLANNNLSPLTISKIDDKENSVHYSFHFDAHLVAKYLKKVGERRKIKTIEGIVKGFRVDKNNQIEKIYLKGNEIIKCDFVFDCTGFKRLIVGKLFETKWKSYNKNLKVNTAIPFFLPQEKEIKPYTRAIAMKYGWMWQIPLQNRYGCGYIFDKNYTNLEDAKKEVVDFIGNKIEFGKQIEFDAGRYEDVWVNNCVAIGLSAGFTEPIEATSIFNVINQLSCISKNNILDYLNGNREFYKEYNNWIAKLNDDVMDFLQFHYFTNRKDTKFWSDYFETSEKSISLENKIKKWKLLKPTELDFENESFGLANWLCVGNGINFFNSDYFIDSYKKCVFKNELEEHHKLQVNNIEQVRKISINQSKALNFLKNFYYGKTNNI
jgi:tryptophan halogenase